MKKLEMMEKNEDISNTRLFWLNKFNSFESNECIPYDMKCNLNKERNTDTIKLKLESNVTEKILKLCNGDDYNILIFFSSLLSILSFKFKESSESAIVTSIINESIEHGLLNTVVPIKTNLRNLDTFKEVLVCTKKEYDDAFSNQNFDMDKLIQHLQLEYGKNDVFPLSGLSIINENIQNSFYINTINYAILLTLSIHEKGISLKFTFDCRLFYKSSVSKLVEYYSNIINSVLQDLNQPLHAISIISDTERENILYGFNKNNSKIEHITIMDKYEEFVNNSPESIAINIDNKNYSYRDLNTAALTLANSLIHKGTQKGDLVALYLERSFELIVSIIAIFKLNCSFLPIDLSFPLGRVKRIIDECDIKTILTNVPLENSFSDLNGKTILHVNEVKSDIPADLKIKFSKCVAEDTAYVIFTSGSTGNPKAVQISHANLYNYSSWAARTYLSDETFGMPLFTSVAYDLTLTSIFGPLIAKKSIVIFNDDINETLFKKIFSFPRKLAIKLTPVHLRLLRDIVLPDINVSCLIVGGENLTSKLANDTYVRFGKNIDIYNEYGPTESTVGCMIHKFSEKDVIYYSVPLGQPINNCKIYVLDENLNPVQMGAEGELFIGGNQLSKGYLNNDNLTEKKFIDNPFAEGRLYKTGDIVRWNFDGSMVFIRRKDEQLKIRGHRIEIEEIKVKLVALEEINDCIVLMKKENEEKDGYLCVYYTSDLDKIKSDFFINYLSSDLPNYMIPSYFIKVDSFPFKLNGKLDIEALPNPLEDIEDKNCYKEPETEIQELMVSIWESLLSRQKIGINDRFFSLGGDSIKIIQFQSRLSEKGLAISLEDVFNSQTINEISKRVKEKSAVIGQDTVKGKVPLTPIQHFFFENKSENRERFSQSILVSINDRIDESALREVCKAIWKHHDALRSIFKIEQNEINSYLQDDLEKFEILEVDLKDNENEIDELNHNISQLQKSFNLNTGRLIKIAIFRMKNCDKLFITIHHLIVDVFSWQILLEDMENFYKEYQKSSSIKLPLKTHSYKYWAESLIKYSTSSKLLQEKEYWQKQLTKDKGYLKQVGNTKKLNNDALKRSKIELTEEDTLSLTNDVHKAYGTNNQDILLAAASLSFWKTFNVNDVQIDMEGHGREQIVKDINVSRTIGWFTCVSPFLLDIKYKNDLDKHLIHVKDNLHRRPQNGIGYGMLKYLTNCNLEGNNAQVLFNYLGQFNNSSNNSLFKVDEGYNDEDLSNIFIDKYLLEINCALTKKISISVTYNSEYISFDEIQTFLRNYEDALQKIIIFCSGKNKQELTSSDYTYKELSIEDLDKLHDLLE